MLCPVKLLRYIVAVKNHLQMEQTRHCFYIRMPPRQGQHTIGPRPQYLSLIYNYSTFFISPPPICAYPRQVNAKAYREYTTKRKEKTYQRCISVQLLLVRPPYIYHILRNFVNSHFAAYYLGSFSRWMTVVGVRPRMSNSIGHDRFRK